MLTDVGRAAVGYAKARRELGLIAARTESELEAVRRRNGPALLKAVDAVNAARLELSELVSAHPELFEKPKTHVFEEIRVGYRKGAGKITWEDEDEVVALIKKHFTKEEAELLIITAEKPNREMLKEMLSVADFAKIGCEVEGSGDVPFIKPLDGSVEKAVKALTKA